MGLPNTSWHANLVVNHFPTVNSFLQAFALGYNTSLQKWTWIKVLKRNITWLTGTYRFNALFICSVVLISSNHCLVCYSILLFLYTERNIFYDFFFKNLYHAVVGISYLVAYRVWRSRDSSIHSYPSWYHEQSVWETLIHWLRSNVALLPMAQTRIKLRRLCCLYQYYVYPHLVCIVLLLLGRTWPQTFVHK